VKLSRSPLKGRLPTSQVRSGLVKLQSLLSGRAPDLKKATLRLRLKLLLTELGQHPCVPSFASRSDGYLLLPEETKVVCHASVAERASLGNLGHGSRAVLHRGYDLGPRNEPCLHIPHYCQTRLGMIHNLGHNSPLHELAQHFLLLPILFNE